MMFCKPRGIRLGGADEPAGEDWLAGALDVVDGKKGFLRRKLSALDYHRQIQQELVITLLSLINGVA